MPKPNGSNIKENTLTESFVHDETTVKSVNVPD